MQSLKNYEGLIVEFDAPNDPAQFAASDRARALLALELKHGPHLLIVAEPPLAAVVAPVLRGGARRLATIRSDGSDYVLLRGL